MDQPASPAAPPPADRLGARGAALLRVPDHLLGGLRSLALESIVILGFGALVGLVHFFVRGTPRIFADVWTAGAYVCFIVGAPLAAQTLLADLRHPDLIDWWPGGMSTRTRFRLPSTSVTYLVADAVPVLVTALVLREPQGRGPMGYLIGAAAVLVALGVAAWRVLGRVRHGPVARSAAESASVDVPPDAARAAAALVGMVGVPVAAVAVLWLRHAGGLTWVLTALGYLVFAALLKAALAVAPRPLVDAPERAPAPRKRGRKRG
ncbi:MAG: hypothetical protein HY906_19530 [Deltaproteobacteria bacterium]|nr:hypothetical protein [Deltaproteobacteria bacterium]